MRMILYQTLQDRDNNEEVEEEGPFKCIKGNAWLGHGYYFWDTHIELGHWWGETVHNNNYIICEAHAKIDDSLWDLVGVGEHRIEFRKACEWVKKQPSFVNRKKELLVPEVITYLLATNRLKYEAIRAHPEHSISKGYRDKKIIRSMKFLDNHIATLDLSPPYQVCLFKKSALSLRNFKVVFPDYHDDAEEFA